MFASLVEALVEDGIKWVVLGVAHWLIARHAAGHAIKEHARGTRDGRP